MVWKLDLLAIPVVESRHSWSSGMSGMQLAKIMHSTALCVLAASDPNMSIFMKPWFVVGLVAEIFQINNSRLYLRQLCRSTVGLKVCNIFVHSMSIFSQSSNYNTNVQT